MIVHSITKDKPQYPVVEYTHPPNNSNRMGKYEYAQYLLHLPFKKGDFIVHRAMVDARADAVFLIKDIVECHWLVKDYEEHIPKCMFVGNRNKVEFFTIPTRWRLLTGDELQHVNTQDFNY